MPIVPSGISARFDSYEIVDEGIVMNFTIIQPGKPTDYPILVSDTELNTVTTLAEFRSLVLGKLNRRYRAVNIAEKLDPRIGQSVVLS